MCRTCWSIWANFGQIRRNSVEVSQSLVKLDRIVANIGKHWATFARLWPTLAKLWHASASFGRVWAESRLREQPFVSFSTTSATTTEKHFCDHDVGLNRRNSGCAHLSLADRMLGPFAEQPPPKQANATFARPHGSDSQIMPKMCLLCQAAPVSGRRHSKITQTNIVAHLFTNCHASAAKLGQRLAKFGQISPDIRPTLTTDLVKLGLMFAYSELVEFGDRPEQITQNMFREDTFE